jgi:DNA-binding NarL/FixJ family response regulator
VIESNVSGPRRDPCATLDRPLRVTIVDTHQLFRECLATALGKWNRIGKVEVAGGRDEALAQLEREEPDVLLVGLARSTGGVELIHEVRRRMPAVRILVLGSRSSEQEGLALMEAGVQGYLMGDQSLEDLRRAVLGLAEGGAVCSPRVTSALFSRLAQLGHQRRVSARLDFLDLTARELEILQLIAEGCSNQAIAERLCLSVHTVKNHVHKILETLGVGSRWAAVEHAIDRGWLKERRRPKQSVDAYSP